MLHATDQMFCGHIGLGAKLHHKGPMGEAVILVLTVVSCSLLVGRGGSPPCARQEEYAR